MKNRIALLILSLGIIAMLVGPFLPIKKTLWTATYQNTKTNQTKVVTTSSGSFIDGTPVFPGGFALMDSFLLLPLALSFYFVFRSSKNKFENLYNNSKLLLTLSILSFISLLFWWGIWTTFAIVPSIGYWFIVLGTVILTIDSLILRKQSK